MDKSLPISKISQKLGPSAERSASFWSEPVFQRLLEDLEQADRPLVVAISGPPSSGKRLLSDFLIQRFAELDMTAVEMALNDFSFDARARAEMAEREHPLFAQRGFPGTYDCLAMKNVLAELCAVDNFSPVSIPRFDKVKDKRFPRSDWSIVEEQPKVVILTGWCLGAVPESIEDLSVCLNAVERELDPEGVFRKLVKERISEEQQPLQKLIDRWVLFEAPNTGVVLEWLLADEAERREQGKPRANRTDSEIHDYVGLIERTLRDVKLSIAYHADFVFELKRDRSILSFSHRERSLSLMDLESA